MKLYDNEEECCGCGACYNICPKEAIEMKYNEKGFLYPEINIDKCIKCGLCKKVCPLKNKDKQDNSESKQIFWALKNLNEEIRENSSSGGFFTALAAKLIENGGKVYGAIWDENMNVCHYGSSINSELDKFRTSKYVQSNTKQTYSDVRKDLKNGRKVLYSGTPCQIAGLKKFLFNVNQENLITIDFVCHGVPSPQVFMKHKEYLQKKYKSRLNKINFRYKTTRGTQNLEIILENGKKIIRTNAEDEYYRLFLSDYILRDSCYVCKYANLNRNSDITMGDFWDFYDSLKEFDDNKGVSLIIINTEKGKKIFDKIINQFDLKEMNVTECMQPNLKEPTKKPLDLKEFWNAFIYKSYKKVVKCYPKYSMKLKIKKKIKKILKSLRLYREK